MDRESLDRIRSATFPIGRRGYEKRAVDRFLQKLADWLETGAGDAGRSELVRHELERLGAKTGKILTEAHDVAEQMLDEAREESHRLREEARGRAVEMRDAATDRIRHMLEDAEGQAEQVRSSADEYAERARAEADRLRAEGEEKLAEAVEKAKLLIAEGQRRAASIAGGPSAANGSGSTVSEAPSRAGVSADQQPADADRQTA